MTLQELDQWPVDNAAGALVVDGTVVDTHGDTSRVFALASVTKLLVAHAAWVAIEEGAVELDQPAGPEGSTVRHLLAHASGLAFDSDKVEAAPGTARIYSSSGFEVLADLISDATGIEFAEYLRQATTEPLGMAPTTLDGPAGHGAHSTVADLARFAGELLSPRVIHRSTLDEAQSVQFPGLDGFVPGYGRQRPNDWGLGPEIRGTKSPHWTGQRNSPQTFGHFGQSGTFLWVDPAIKTACVVLTDRDFGAWAKPLWSDFNTSVVQSLPAS